MSLIAQQVFKSLDPYRVVSGLKLPMEQENGLYLTVHPQYPEHKLQIARNEFVGMAYNSPTPACNVFDFLALHFGSYEKAVDYVCEQYYNLAQIPTGVTLASIRNNMIESLKDDRDQFEEILNLREPLRLHDSSLASAYLYCRSRGLSPDHTWRIFYIVLGSKLNKILHYAPSNVDRFKDHVAYLVYPYLKNRHTFAMLQVKEIEGKAFKTVSLNPSRNMFFGLHSCLPGSDQVRVFEKPEDALVMHSHAMQLSNFNTGFISVGFNSNVAPEEAALKEGIFMKSRDTDVNVLAKTRTAFETFLIGDYNRRFSEEVIGEPWDHHIMNTVVAMLNTDTRVTPRITSFIESLKGDQQVCNQLLYYLEQCKEYIYLEKIKKHVDIQQVFTVGNMQITETDTGYVAHRVGANTTSHFTNFLIKIDLAIWFEESQETFYSGRVVLNGNQIPFLISSNESRVARRIIAETERAVNKAGITSDVNLPTVTDTTFSARLVDIIAAQLGNKPRRIGIQRLGWNKTRSRFITTTWEAHSLGITPTSHIIHPDSELISKHFNPQDYPSIVDISLVTPQARYLMALVVASMTRAFLNQQTPTITLIRSEHSLSLLAAVFRPLGQISPVELNPNRRLVMDMLSAKHFQGYPIYATCPDISAVENFNFPLFLLSDSGFPLHEPVTPEAALQITSFAHKIFTTLTIDFARDNVKVHNLIDSDFAPPIAELALEGKRIIQERCGISNFDLFEPELPLMQTVLSNIPVENCDKYFRLDIQDQTISIRCRLISNLVTRVPLYEELVAKNPKVMTSDHYISCPMAWFLNLLASFYGKQIQLYHQPPDSGPDATTAQGDSRPISNT